MKRSLGLRLCRFMDSEKLIGASDLASELNEAIEELDELDAVTWRDHLSSISVGALQGVAIGALVLCGGFAATTFITLRETPHYKMPIPITLAEMDDDRVVGVTTPDTSITVEWDDPKIFDMHISGHAFHAGGYTEYDKYKFPWPFGFISWGAHCVVHLPAGSKVEGIPGRPSSGMWSDPWDGTALAHEILHCLRGDWHWEQPGMLDQASGKEMRKP